jgi:hypothetical protein
MPVAPQILITVHHSHQWISILSYRVIVMDNSAPSNIAINATALLRSSFLMMSALFHSFWTLSLHFFW